MGFGNYGLRIRRIRIRKGGWDLGFGRGDWDWELEFGIVIWDQGSRFGIGD